MLFRLLRTYLRPYRRWLWLVVLFQLISSAAMLYLPTLNADIIDGGVAQGDIGYIITIGLVMLAASLAQICTRVAAVWFGSRSAMGLGRDLRRDLFRTINGFSSREVAQIGAASLITRSANDVQQVQMVTVMAANVAVSAPIMMVGGIIMAVQQDIHLSVLLVVAIPVMFAAMALIVSRMVPNFRQQQIRIDGVNRVLREQITGIRVVRAFVREPVEEARFAEANDALTDVSLRAGRWMSTIQPVMMLLVNIASVGVIWLGGHYIEDGVTQVGSLTAFLTYLMQILMSVMMANFMMMMVPRASVSAERISEVLDTETTVVAPVGGVRETETHGHLDLDDVAFTYPGAEAAVLHDVSLSARPGQTVAIIGSTGAGKSTLVNLIPRLADATGGSVRVDGVDVRQLDPDALRARIGLVPQKAFLFSGTVRSNLLYGKPDATEEELWHALEVAQARDFVERLGGLETPIVQGGTNVSGGQRQRLAIARALVRRPEIYLFDDSFSALDVATDARLRAALEPETRDATVIIVAQRVATIRDADLILVMEDGAIVGRGTHEELVASNETYQEIVTSQLSAEEAA